MIKDLFTTNSDLVGRASNLGTVLGPGSTFSLDGDEHRARRKLLVPPFHGKRMVGYEAIVEEEVMREIASWPEGREFETLEPMMRITLNAILRTVFGAQGSAFDELRELFPPMIPLASRMAVMPAAFRRDLGSWSPWGRVQRYRRRYNEIIAGLIAEARNDPAFEERNDVLALMLAARYEDGSPISDDHIADELLTLLSAGHETTATTLAWAVERLRRHPRLLTRLTAEVDAGRYRAAAGHDLGSAAHPPRRGGNHQGGARTNPAGRVGHPEGPRRHREHHDVALLGAELRRPEGVQPGPLPRRQPRHPHLDSLRRRHPPVHRRRVRQHGDERHAADTAPRIRVRHNICRR